MRRKHSAAIATNYGQIHLLSVGNSSNPNVRTGNITLIRIGSLEIRDSGQEFSSVSTSEFYIMYLVETSTQTKYYFRK